MLYVLSLNPQGLVLCSYLLCAIASQEQEINVTLNWLKRLCKISIDLIFEEVQVCEFNAIVGQIFSKFVQ